ncbi:helix-turn-helix transcriptional regulator [Arthrobacter sp. M2012083]|uniref:helix-turn-helix transcriptional regulator n=1 Tax=Arthrobacter sp. M2012083 TaxID=1197706 RepID=UPI0002E7189C|nr:helix-turn-helix transcriptional regulator [Arthrobacter sp. M2012083]
MTADNLASFLRARRNAAAADIYPWADLTPRRVPGLRREEVAELAGLSTDYYVRLEQGREKHPSEQVVAALSAALRLSKYEDDHLRLLAGFSVQPVQAESPVDPSLIHMLNSWVGSPAFILDPLLNFRALNPVARILFSAFDDLDNLTRSTFLDPAARRFFVDWARAAESCVASLRATMHLHHSSHERDELVQVLRQNKDFETLWQRFDIQPKTQETKLIFHESVGELELNFQAFHVMSSPGQQLVVYQAAPGSRSEDQLRTLVAMDAGNSGRAAGRAQELRTQEATRGNYPSPAVIPQPAVSELSNRMDSSLTDPGRGT